MWMADHVDLILVFFDPIGEVLHLHAIVAVAQQFARLVCSPPRTEHAAVLSVLASHVCTVPHTRPLLSPLPPACLPVLQARRRASAPWRWWSS